MKSMGDPMTKIDLLTSLFFNVYVSLIISLLLRIWRPTESTILTPPISGSTSEDDVSHIAELLRALMFLGE